MAVVAALALALGAGASGAGIALALDDDEPTRVVETNASGNVDSTPAQSGDDEPPLEGLAGVAAAATPSVVSIGVEGEQGQGQGSGIVLSEDGLILTNNHVVAGADSVEVTFSDGEEADADVLDGSPEFDVAVVQAEDVSGLEPATLGSSTDLNVGDTVIAIGSPLTLTGSVTSGIVSALNRDIDLQGPTLDDEQQVTSVASAIQTDAAINPGNSGGPLINNDGAVVGINTAIAAAPGTGGLSSGGNIGIGFAIPIEDAERVAKQIIQGGEVAIAFLGVNIAPAETDGALIVEVTDDSPAADAGLQADDVVTAVDDEPVDSHTALTAIVRRHQPGDEVTITFERDGEERTADVTLGSLDEFS